MIINRIAPWLILIEVLIANTTLSQEGFLTEIDIEQYGCDSIKLKEAEESLNQLSQTLNYVQTGKLEEDISELREIYILLKSGIDEEVQKNFLKFENFQYPYILKQKLDLLRKMGMNEQLINSRFDDIRFQINQIIEVFKEQRSQINNEIISQKIEILIDGLNEIERQYKNLQETNIKELISKIEIIRNICYDKQIISQEKKEVDFLLERSEQSEKKDIIQSFEIAKGSLLSENHIIMFDQNKQQIKTKNNEFEIVRRICVSGESQIIEMAQSQRQVLDLKVNDVNLGEEIEYGYGYWIRWLTRWPDRLKGINEAWYFISRLTKNDPYENIGMGDRLLSIWLGQSGYTFVTNDIVTGNPNLKKQLPYEDIEGLWTYIHFSYKKGQAVGIIKMNDKIQFVILDAIHDQPKILRLIIGGSDLNLYKGFNGQISSPILKLGSGSFINCEDDFNTYIMACNHIPQFDCTENSQIIKLNQDIKRYDSTYQEINEQFNEQQLLTIYGIGGWYKWVDMKEEIEHLTFRITINNPNKNNDEEQLGDNTLTLFLTYKQLYAFSTYSYSNMFGEGESNITQFIQHQNKHTLWHYISFKYNRELRQAYGQIIFEGEKVSFTFQNINHYLVPNHFIIIGKDAFKSGYNGYIADLTYITCEDLYNEQFQPNHNPQFPIHSTLYVSVSSLNLEQKCQINDHNIVDSAFDDNQPLAEVEITDNLIKQYGYSFWLRYFTRYPKPMYQGKNQPWYFISRLTNNQNYSDKQIGYKLLDIMQGQGFYTFFTNDFNSNNQNLNQSLEYYDIEGLWTYFYFSYSSIQQKAVGFIKYSHEDPQSVVFNVYHESIVYLKLIIGGSDSQIYPAINGQFTKANFKITQDAFIDTVSILNQFALECNPLPQEFCTQYFEQIIIDEYIKFYDTKEYQSEISSNSFIQFPNEYSVQGWFKWETTLMENWHLAFRLHINKGQTNENDSRLGDRTLAAWVSPSQDGIYAMTTYSYLDLNNGKGQSNIAQIIPQNQQQTDWHFIFFSYNRQTRIAEGYIQFQNKKESIHFENINHFLVPQMYLNIGKDRFYKSWNGYIGKFKMNLCSGASKPTQDFLNPPPNFNSFPKFYVTETIEHCLIDTQVIEITQVNLKSVINTLQRQETQERICYCSPSKIEQLKV